MRFIFFILLFPSFVAAQITDSFSDNDFSSNPTWSGDANEFIVNPSQQLQLNNTIAGSSYLFTKITATSLTNIEWKFYIKQFFSPSSSNYGRVYLASDQANLEAALNGYYLQFGEAGSLDAVELFRQTGITSTSIARGINAQIASSFALSVKVTHDSTGIWNLYIDTTGGTAYKLATSGTDNTYTSTNYFGVATVYTASNANKFYFDDFYIGPIIIDTIAPTVITSSVISANQIDILFDESVDLITSQTIANYTADNGLGNPTNALRDINNFKLVHLTFTNKFISEFTYTLTINNVRDFNSNTTPSSIFFSYYQLKPLDIVINEILFDPKTDGVDFVEIYNRSNNPIDLKSITLSQYDTINNVLTSIKPIATIGYFILPQTYIVLSQNSTAVKNQYHTTNPNGFIDMNSLPNMSISGGTICIANGATVIDLFKYYPNMHFPLLNNTKGVSLERVSFDRPTQDRSNWHSAAQSVDFATPAYKNSQYNNATEIATTIEIIPEIFSPDEDGINDIVNIHYHFDTPGYLANIIIYDSKGYVIKSLMRNQLLGTSGVFSWDGINDNNEKARIGIYIIYVEAIDLSGNVKHYKKTCVLGGKL